MRARPAQVQSLQGRAVLRVSGNRPVEQQLVERQFALENVALGQSDLGLEFALLGKKGIEQYSLPATGKPWV